jgi:hypothetical protein
MTHAVERRYPIVLICERARPTYEYMYTSMPYMDMYLHVGYRDMHIHGDREGQRAGGAEKGDWGRPG